MKNAFSMFRLLPSLGLFVACMTIVLAIPSSTVQHPVDGIVGASNVDGPSGHASFRLHPRSPSIPERCVQHESYVRLEESIKNAQITDPELDFDYWLHQRAPTALHPGRLQLKPAEEAALKMELDSFWEAFRFAGFSMPPGQWTVRARDICINAFKRGFESGAKLANLLYPEDWAGMFERGFHRRPTDVFDIIWTERDRQARQAYVAGTKEFKKFSGTHSEGNIHLRCLEKGRLTRRLDSTPEQQEGILRGQQNGLRVGVCNRKMKEQVRRVLISQHSSHTSTTKSIA